MDSTKATVDPETRTKRQREKKLRSKMRRAGVEKVEDLPLTKSARRSRNKKRNRELRKKMEELLIQPSSNQAEGSATIKIEGSATIKSDGSATTKDKKSDASEDKVKVEETSPTDFNEYERYLFGSHSLPLRPLPSSTRS